MYWEGEEGARQVRKVRKVPPDGAFPLALEYALAQSRLPTSSLSCSEETEAGACVLECRITGMYWRGEGRRVQAGARKVQGDAATMVPFPLARYARLKAGAPTSQSLHT
jgi:hypothetical protein